MDLRAERTRKLLFAAFTNLISKQDFDSITVSELCNAAMVRRATFYRHFGSKEDFFAAYVGYIRQHVSMLITGEADSNLSTYNYCLRMTEHLADLLEKNETIVRRQVLGGSFDRLLAIAINQIAKDLDRQVLQASGNGESAGIAAFYIGGLFGLVRHYFSCDGVFDKEHFLTEHRVIIERLFG